MRNLPPNLLRLYRGDPVVDALMRLERLERDKARGITETGRHVVPMALRCARCQGRRVVVVMRAGEPATRPCPYCNKSPSPALECMGMAA